MKSLATLQSMATISLCILLAFNPDLTLAQDTPLITDLRAEQQKSKREMKFVMGQTVRYKTKESPDERKGKIVGITDSTITLVSRGKKTITIRHNDFTELVTLSAGKGGTTLIVIGVAGILVGAYAEGVSESNIGSGEKDPGAITAMVAGAAVLTAGIILKAVNTRKADLSTLKTVTRPPAKQDTLQFYRKFKFGVGTGYASNNGALVYLEPRYSLWDQLAIGLKGEFVFGSTGINSLSLNGQYYFSDAKVRPFIGAGVGGYSYNGTTNFGFHPRFGLDYDHFTLTLDYNVLPVTWVTEDYTYYSGFGTGPAIPMTSQTLVQKETSYLGFKIGISLGGGKIKPGKK